MRILIVVPNFTTQYRRQYNFPIGLAYISAALKKSDYDVRILNLNHQGNEYLSSLERKIVEDKIDMVMTGGLTFHLQQLKEIFDTAKKISKNIITIGGGGGFTSEPILFSELTNVDYACLGEGEITNVELVNAIVGNMDVSAVRGIVYKNETGQYVKTADRPPIDDLDSIAFPDYDGFELGKFLEEQTPYDYYYTYICDEPRMMPIVMGRSCPYQCSFCFHPLGNKYRQRSLDNFFAELDSLLSRYQINSLSILDELFSMNEDMVIEFCNRIRPYQLKWTVQMRVSIANENLLKTMRDSGCFNISYGIESISDKVLKSMGKHITKCEIENALYLTQKVGIGIQGNFIFGDEQEDMETFSETISWWRAHRQYQLNLGFIETYPGTKLYKNAVEKGIIKDKKAFIQNNCPVINLTGMSNSDFDKMRDVVELENLQRNDITGEVINIEPEEGNTEFVTFTFKCGHCGTQNKVKHIKKMRIYSNAFKICCRECNQKSSYDTRAYLGIRDSENRNKMYNIVFRQWMRDLSDKDKEQNISTKLKKEHIRKIAIMADEYVTPFLIKNLLREGEISIEGLIVGPSENEYIMSQYNIALIKQQDINQLKDIDAVIIADVYDYKYCKQLLVEKSCQFPVISISDIIFGLSLH